jgi:hypothetical protein
MVVDEIPPVEIIGGDVGAACRYKGEQRREGEGLIVFSN